MTLHFHTRKPPRVDLRCQHLDKYCPNDIFAADVVLPVLVMVRLRALAVGRQSARPRTAGPRDSDAGLWRIAPVPSTFCFNVVTETEYPTSVIFLAQGGWDLTGQLGRGLGPHRSYRLSACGRSHQTPPRPGQHRRATKCKN